MNEKLELVGRSFVCYPQYKMNWVHGLAANVNQRTVCVCVCVCVCVRERERERERESNRETERERQGKRNEREGHTDREIKKNNQYHKYLIL